MSIFQCSRYVSIFLMALWVCLWSQKTNACSNGCSHDPKTDPPSATGWTHTTSTVLDGSAFNAVGASGCSGIDATVSAWVPTGGNNGCHGTTLIFEGTTYTLTGNWNLSGGNGGRGGNAILDTETPALSENGASGGHGGDGGFLIICADTVIIDSSFTFVSNGGNGGSGGLGTSIYDCPDPSAKAGDGGDGGNGGRYGGIVINGNIVWPSGWDNTFLNGSTCPGSGGNGGNGGSIGVYVSSPQYGTGIPGNGGKGGTTTLTPCVRSHNGYSVNPDSCISTYGDGGQGGTACKEGESCEDCSLFAPWVGTEGASGFRPWNSTSLCGVPLSGILNNCATVENCGILELECDNSISGRLTEFPTRFATTSCDEGISLTLYYVDVPVTGTQVLATFVHASDYGIVSILTGQCPGASEDPNSLIERACDASDTDPTVQAFWTSTTDNQRIYIGIYSEVADGQELEISCVTPSPGTDACGSSFFGEEFVYTGLIHDGVSTTNHPTACYSSASLLNDRWFKIYVPERSFVTASFASTVSAAGVGIYGGTCTALSEVGCQLAGHSTPVITRVVEPGYYWIRVAILTSATPSSSQSLTVTTVPVPAGDVCSTAIEAIVDWEEEPYSFGGSITSIASASGQSASCLGTGWLDRWYVVELPTPQSSMYVSFSGGSVNQSAIAVYHRNCSTLLHCTSRSTPGSLSINGILNPYAEEPPEHQTPEDLIFFVRLATNGASTTTQYLTINVTSE